MVAGRRAADPIEGSVVAARPTSRTAAGWHRRARYTASWLEAHGGCRRSPSAGGLGAGWRRSGSGSTRCPPRPGRSRGLVGPTRSPGPPRKTAVGRSGFWTLQLKGRSAGRTSSPSSVRQTLKLKALKSSPRSPSPSSRGGERR